MVKITNKGFKGEGIYVGRPSVFGNPFPTKQNKFSDKVYTLRHSLNLYKKHFEDSILRTKAFRGLIKQYHKENFIQLDCWCINRYIRSSEEIDINKCKCHAEVIAYYILYLSEPFYEDEWLE